MVPGFIRTHQRPAISRPRPLKGADCTSCPIIPFITVGTSYRQEEYHPDSQRPFVLTDLASAIVVPESPQHP